MVKNGKQILFWIVAVILIMVMLNGQKEGKKESLAMMGDQYSCLGYQSTGWKPGECSTSCFELTSSIINTCGTISGINYYSSSEIGQWSYVYAYDCAFPIFNGQSQKVVYDCLLNYGIPTYTGPDICPSLRTSAWNAALTWASNPTSTNKDNAVNSIISWAGAC